MYSNEHEEGDKAFHYILKIFFAGVSVFGLMTLGTCVTTP